MDTGVCGYRRLSDPCSVARVQIKRMSIDAPQSKTRAQIMRLRGLALVTAIPFQFIWFKPEVYYFMSRVLPSFYIFFALAGYELTASICARNQVSSLGAVVREVFGERMRRLLPALLTWLAVVNILAVLFNSSGSFGRDGVVAGDTLATLTVSYNIIKSQGINQEESDYWNVLGTYWHITFEEQYCFMCVLLLFYITSPSSRRRFFVIFTILSAIVLRALPFFCPPSAVGYYSAFSPLRNVTPFAVGSLVYVLQGGVVWQRLNALKRFEKQSLALFAMLGAYFYFYILPFDLNWFAMIPYWLMLFLFVMLITLPNDLFLRSRFTKGLFGYIGSRFYFLYLGHAIVIRFVEEVAFRISGTRTPAEGLAWPVACAYSFVAVSLLVLVSEGLHRLFSTRPSALETLKSS